MDPEQTYIFIDSETNTSYGIKLTPEEYKRAENDLLYATKVLEEAKERETKNPSTKEDNFYDNKENDEEISSWTRKATLLFIELYKKYEKDIESGKCTQKIIFDKISRGMQHKGHNFTNKQCTTKLTSLKRMYKKIKDHNGKSGNDKQTWQYYDALDEIFHKKPWVLPPATASSTSSTSVSDTDEKPNVSGTKKRKLERLFDEHLQKVLGIKTQQKADREKQHEEKMKRLDTANSLLEKLVTAMSKDKST